MLDEIANSANNLCWSDVSLHVTEALDQPDWPSSSGNERRILLNTGLLTGPENANDEAQVSYGFSLTVGKSRYTRKTFVMPKVLPADVKLLLKGLILLLGRQTAEIRQVHISTNASSFVFPLNSLAALIGKLPHLTSLQVSGCLVWSNDGPDDDAQHKVTTALRQHSTLRSLSLHDVQVGKLSSWDEKYGVLDPLLEAISTIHNLESIDLSIFQEEEAEQQPLDTRDGDNLDLNHLDDFAYAFWTGGRRRLQRIASIRKPATVSEGNCNRKNKSLLVSPRVLRLLLQNLCNLEDLSLWNMALTDTHVKESFVPVLRGNPPLRFLSLRQNEIREDGWTHVYHAVEESNYTLMHIISDQDPISEDELVRSSSNLNMLGEFVLRLNQGGRSDILRQTKTASGWCQVLQDCSNDPASFFYYLRQAIPTLVATMAM